MSRGSNRLGLFFGVSFLAHVFVCVCGAAIDVHPKAKVENYYDVALLKEQPKAETSVIAPEPETQPQPKRAVKPRKVTNRTPKETRAPKNVVKVTSPAPQPLPEKKIEEPKHEDTPPPVEATPPVLASAASNEPLVSEPAPAATGQTPGTGGVDRIENKGTPDGVEAAPRQVVDWKKAYKRKIYSQIQRSKQYPYAARRAGMEGRVVVRFTVSSSGSLQSVSVVSSSPYDVLNSDALDWIRRAAPFPAFPEEADESGISLTYGLRYNLTD